MLGIETRGRAGLLVYSKSVDAIGTHENPDGPRVVHDDSGDDRDA